MPPVREASTKPSAATVLPAPVACSNQKRLPAFGSSGASATSSSLLAGRLVPVLRLLGLVLVLVLLARRDRSTTAATAPRRERPGSAAGGGAAASPFLQAIGEQRGQRARERVDLVGGEHGAVDERAARPGRAAARARAAATTGGASAATGPSRPVSSSRGRRRAPGGAGVPGRERCGGVLPSVRKGSRANAEARSISSIEGSVAASATGVVSAMNGSESDGEKRTPRDAADTPGETRGRRAPGADRRSPRSCSLRVTAY